MVKVLSCPWLIFKSLMEREEEDEQNEGSSSPPSKKVVERKKVTRDPRNESHIQLSESIWVFFDEKLSKHVEIFGGEQLHGKFATLPIAVKLVDNTEQNKREARILSKLNHHSNVISLIETGFYDGGFQSYVYMALDRCHQENLRQFVENRNEEGIPFDRKLAIGILRQIICGVEYIHGKNISHNDLKPDNILFTLDQKTIKIADFGLSEEITGKVFVKYQFGTNGFRPPESFGNSYVSLKSDIFSLGAVFYFVLSYGKNPFGDDLDGQNINIREGKIDLSCLLVPNPETTKHLIKCMIESKRKNRPTISQVSEHPCWTGAEAECDFDYNESESSDSDPCEEEEEPSYDIDDLSSLISLLEKSTAPGQASTQTKLKGPDDVNYDVSRDGTSVKFTIYPNDHDVTHTISLHHNGQKMKSVETSTLSTRISDLKPRTEYQCSVRARNVHGHESDDFNFFFTTNPGERDGYYRDRALSQPPESSSQDDDSSS